MKKNIKVTYKSLAFIFYALFIIAMLFLVMVLPNLTLTDDVLSKIWNFIFVFIIIDGCIALLFTFINGSLEEHKKDNTAFIIRRRFINKYCNIKILFGIAMFILVLLFVVVVKDRLNEIEYKDLIYSLKDNSDYDNRITKKNSTRDYKSLNSNMFLGYKVENKEIIESYICFIYNDKLTCLKVGKNNYKKNKNKIENIFGKNNCFDYQDYYQCSDIEHDFNINKNGNLSIMFNYNDDEKDYCYSKGNKLKCNLIKDYE